MAFNFSLFGNIPFIDPTYCEWKKKKKKKSTNVKFERKRPPIIRLLLTAKRPFRVFLENPFFIPGEGGMGILITQVLRSTRSTIKKQNLSCGPGVVDCSTGSLQCVVTVSPSSPSVPVNLVRLASHCT